jgi:hypothetical protein
MLSAIAGYSVDAPPYLFLLQRFIDQHRGGPSGGVPARFRGNGL